MGGCGRVRQRGSAGGAIDGGVERGIVVHLELAVKFEAALAGESLLPERVETGGEVAALVEEDGEAFLIALGVACGRVGALSLLAGVEDFEREDGEAVDDEAGGFGVERCGGVGQRAVRKPVEEVTVKLFSEIVAELIGAVDAAFDGGELGVRSAGRAGFVLDVPEVEVGAVLAGDGVEECVVGVGG